jgi:TIR domain
MVVGQVFSEPAAGALLAENASLLETLQAGLAGQLAVLDDPSLTGTAESSAEVLGLPPGVLAQELTSSLIRQIMVRAFRGGPLTPLASQLNHDATHLQSLRIESMLGQLADEVREALARRAIEQSRDTADRAKVARHVFISYVHEDSAQVNQLQQALQAAGIPVWRDTADLWPGEDWRAKIRGAITENAFVFIACFSQRSLARGKSYQNEELTLAIEQLRLRPPEHPWLIPVRFDECEIPDRDIGGGRTLTSIQRADLFGERSDEGAARLVAAVLRILRRQADTGEAEMQGQKTEATSTEIERPKKDIICPICLSELEWSQLPLWRWDKDRGMYVELEIPAGASRQLRARLERGATVRCPDRHQVMPQHFLPVDYGRYGQPVVLAFIGASTSGKTHLLSAMIGEIELGGLREVGITSHPVDRELHRRFLDENVVPLMQDQVLSSTPEGAVTFADALLIGPQGGSERPVAFFDVAAADLRKAGNSPRFLEIADGLIFVVAPADLAGNGLGDDTFNVVLDVLYRSARLSETCAAVVLNKADTLPPGEPLARWLTVPLTRTDPDLVSRESADVRSYLENGGGHAWMRPYRECGKATMHVVSATGRSLEQTATGPRYSQVTPRRVLGPLLAMLAMTGVLYDENAQHVGASR